jgi:hypothetical protein
MLTPSDAHHTRSPRSSTGPRGTPRDAAGRRGVPPGAPDRLGHVGRCRCCGRPVVFRETPGGRWQPWGVDPGTGEVTAVPSGTCPARRWAKREQRVREGQPPDVPLDRCHRPVCGAPDPVSLAPTGAGGHGHLWASRCLACGVHRFLPEAFAPPAGALPAGAAPVGGPPATLPALRPWRRPEWDWQWGSRAAGGRAGWPKLPGAPPGDAGPGPGRG